MSNLALLGILFATIAVGAAVYVYRYKGGSKQEFSETFPGTDDIRAIGYKLEYGNGKVTYVATDVVWREPFVVHPGIAITIRPCIDNDFDAVKELKFRTWMSTISLQSSLVKEVAEDGCSCTIVSGGTPLVLPPKELTVCFEAIDVRSGVTYQRDIVFVHTSETP